MANPVFDLELPALRKDIRGPTPGASGLLVVDVDRFLADDVPVQAQLMCKESPEDTDAEGAAVTIAVDLTSQGQITRLTPSRIRCTFELKPSFTRKFADPRGFGLGVWITRDGLPLRRVVQDGVYTPDQFVTLKDGDIINTSTPETVEIIGPNPSANVYYLGGPVELTAQALEEDGSVLPGATFSWFSGDDSIATMDNDGVLTPTGNGDVTITAVSRGVEGSKVIHVTRSAIVLNEDGTVLLNEDGSIAINES